MASLNDAIVFSWARSTPPRCARTSGRGRPGGPDEPGADVGVAVGVGTGRPGPAEVLADGPGPAGVDGDAAGPSGGGAATAREATSALLSGDAAAWLRGSAAALSRTASAVPASTTAA